MLSKLETPLEATGTCGGLTQPPWRPEIGDKLVIQYGMYGTGSVQGLPGTTYP